MRKQGYVIVTLTNKDRITDCRVSAYQIPTDHPESDGTLEWDSTTLVLVELKGAEQVGVGYTYGDAAISSFIAKRLAPLVIGQDAFDIPRLFTRLSVAIRNEGNAGMAYMGLSAVDSALWDLKAKLLGVPLCRLLGMARTEAEVYGSGGFTSYSDERLAEQLAGWAGSGCRNVKMKVGRHPGRDVERVKVARRAIGAGVGLFVDANGAYRIKQALAMAAAFAESGVCWFEEPVSSDDLAGMRFVRERSPAGMMIAAGEYGYAADYFLHMLQSAAVDVLQADATRCGGISGLLRAGQLCETFNLPFSFHCAPALHLHTALCLPSFSTGEYFHDHARIEGLLFDGAPTLTDGRLRPDLSRPGMGLEFKHPDAARYKVT